MKKTSLRAITGVIVLTGILAGCSKPPAELPPPRPLRVVALSAGSGAAGTERIYSGELRPRVDTVLGFQVGGKIVERRVNTGDHVNRGQVLARLDPQDTQLAAAQSEAQRSLAQAEALRYRDLHARKFVSQAALDARETALKANEAQAALTRNQSAYTTLIADKSGVIGPVLADVGQVVSPGQGVLRMAPDGDREIALNVPETDLQQFRIGRKAEVTLWSMPGKTYEGRIREISPVADPATRTYAMRVQLAGVEKLPTGLSAVVKFTSDEGSKAVPAFAIPLTAVYQDGKQAAVWKVDADDTVKLVPVTVLGFHDQFALIAGNLTDGERIAAAGVHRLQAGEKVRPVVVERSNAS